MGGSVSGFREETDFMIKLAYAGYKMIVDTGAKAWHLQATSGGARGKSVDEYKQAVAINEEHFRRKFLYQFRKSGDPYKTWR